MSYRPLTFCLAILILTGCSWNWERKTQLAMENGHITVGDTKKLVESTLGAGKLYVRVNDPKTNERIEVRTYSDWAWIGETLQEKKYWVLFVDDAVFAYGREGDQFQEFSRSMLAFTGGGGLGFMCQMAVASKSKLETRVHCR